MATDGSTAPVNGTYHGGYDQSQTSGYTNSAQAPAASSTPEIPKDEVGWYFVEQYYTTLSRSPEKLYLFYNKRSQFVLGQEADKVAVCVGQKSINERIKELDFRDCKVRVTNVDSQASDTNIVIQVIGEISNKSQPHKKFTQTFVLAGQTNGYFVLNDIFRYIVEEEDEQDTEQAQPTEVEESAPAATEETLTSSQEPAAVEESARKVDEELEQKVLNVDPSERASPPPNAINGAPEPSEEELAQVSDAPAAAPLVENESAKPVTQDVKAQAETLEPEKPAAPEPTPAVSPVKQNAQPAAAGAAPSKPSVPKSWASLAAAAHKVIPPAVPVPQLASTPAAQQSKAAPAPSASPAAQTGAPAPATNAAAPAESAKQDDEWVSVGDNKKQQGRTQAAAGAQEGPQNRAYIKNVSEGVDSKDLKTLLEKFGEVTYFDVSRQKNCAFVDFKTSDGYKAAIAGNPHQLGGDSIVVEERRPKPGMPFAARGGARGGRGGQTQGGRGSFQGGRGGFAGRGRGGGNTQRGRGGAQAA